VLAAKTLGHLAICGTNTSDFVGMFCLLNHSIEFEVNRALEWLSTDRVESKRFAAVMILCELSKSAPLILFTFVGKILELIWIPLKDSKVTIREGAADALSACLYLVSQRESSSRKQWYRKIYDEIHKGCKSNSPEINHGSLLALKELLTHTDKVSTFSFNVF
jgi:FKBP12-rapamycin complex-associated protein